MNKTKKLLTVLLAAVLCLSLLASLAGCNKNDTPEPTNSAQPTNNGGSDNKGGNGGATPAPDTYVYNAKLIPLEGMENGGNLLACRSDRLLVPMPCRMKRRS